MSHHHPTGPLDPVAAQIAAFFAADPGWQALTTLPPAEVRAGIRAATPVTGEPALARVEDFAVPVAGGTIGVRFYAPVAAPPALLVWAHGGGFVLGSIDEIDNFCRALAAASGCAIASVEYRLAPEHRFPTAVEDVEAAVQWVLARRAALAGSAVPVFVGGDSAGANLATVVTRRLHAAGAGSMAGPIAGNILAYPATEGPEAESLRRFEAPFLGLREVTHFSNLYCPDPALHRHPDFAPAWAPDLHLLPATLLITADHDVLTEQGEAYADKLAASGVAVTRQRHAGMIHGFLTMDAFLPGAGACAMAQISAFLAGHRC